MPIRWGGPLIGRTMRLGVFFRGLNAVPGFKESRRTNARASPDFDDRFAAWAGEAGDIMLPSDIERQHAVVMRHLVLKEIALSFKSCEHYFRRFPFKGLAVSRHEHLSNACELYFDRFYQSRARIKKLSRAVTVLRPNHGIQFAVHQADRCGIRPGNQGTSPNSPQRPVQGLRG
jgi:hypothetical protein